MATWTDGAAYAPLERPYGFATPEAPPLEAAEPAAAPTPGPVPPPQGFAPSGPQIPLDQVMVADRRPRDPAFPFTTATAAIASAPPPASGNRDPRAPFTVYDTASAGRGVDSAELPPPSGAPLAAPVDASFPQVNFPPPNFPPPSTPAPIAGSPAPPPMPQPQWPPAPPPGAGPQQWPGQPWGPQGAQPSPYWTQPPGGNTPLGADKSVRNLLIIGLVGLLLGVLVPAAASWLLLIAGLLFTRTRHVTGALGTATTLAGVSLLMLTLIVDDVSPLAVLACLGLGGWALYSLLRSPSPRR